MTTKILNFKKWLSSWDERIETHDDRDSKDIIHDRLVWSIGVINSILNDTDQKAMAVHESSEAKVKALFHNQSKPFYKDLEKVSNNLTVTMMQIDAIYELKNRKSYDVIKLRAQLAKTNNLKNKL